MLKLNFSAEYKNWEVKKYFINLYFQSTLQTCNLNTFVLENDFEYSPFLLTKLEHDFTIFPHLPLAYTFDVLDLIRHHNQPNTIRYLLYAIYYTLCTMHYILCIIHYALCIIHYALCTMHYALCTIHTYLYVFICIYYFTRIHTYLLFHVEIRRNPVISVPTRSSLRVE